MTLVLSISANTAATAIEAIKNPRRLSTKDQVADIKADAERNVRRAANAGDPGGVGIAIPPATISLDLLGADQQPRQQTTLHQAKAAYRDLDP
jgi:hypothetical protein